MPYAEPNLISALQQGSLSLAYGISPGLFALGALSLTALVYLGYRHSTRPLSRAWKAYLITLRALLLTLLLFCLLRPTVSVSRITPQETYLGVLFDSSLSMTVADLPGGNSRAQSVQDEFFASGLMGRLSEDFQLRAFHFDATTRRALANDEAYEGDDGESAAATAGTASAIGQALEHLRQQLGGLPLSAVVLVSDGADNSGIDPLTAAARLAAAQVPVFSVGVGREEIPQDIAIVDVSVAKTVLDGAVFTLQVSLRQHGYAGRQVNLELRDSSNNNSNNIAAQKPITLEEDGILGRYEMEISPQRPGLIAYELQVQPQPGEIIPQNNRYRFLVDNTPKPPLDILYVEGHPRNEYKFIRRAVAGDSSIRLASYLQTGPEKFYRQGINSPTELAAGFPTDRESLYAYEALILGDVEAEFFTAAQLQLMQDFVAERGGGLLLSGMVDAGFMDSPVADVLPLTLLPPDLLPMDLRGGIRWGEHATGELFSPRLTGNGEFSLLLRLAADSRANLARWQQLPPLQGVFVSGRVKPGAAVLLEHPLLRYQGQPLPVLVSQRYGRGRSMALTTASTWRWQMMMPAEDNSHEVLWRQMLRWLAVSAPQRITLEFDREFYHAGDTVNVTARVLDRDYQPDNDATLWMQATDPLDRVSDLPMTWDLAEDGVYRGSFPAGEEGVYSLLVEVAGATAADARQRRAGFVVTPSLREFSDAAMDKGLLTRIAEVGGGSYFDLADVADLSAALQFTPSPYSRQVEYDLWHRPWLLGLLLVLLCADWISRRWKGLA